MTGYTAALVLTAALALAGCGRDDCTKGRDRVGKVTLQCGGTIPEAEDTDDIECTTAAGDFSLCLADCYKNADCRGVPGHEGYDPTSSQAAKLSECSDTCLNLRQTVCDAAQEAVDSVVEACGGTAVDLGSGECNTPKATLDQCYADCYQASSDCKAIDGSTDHDPDTPEAQSLQTCLADCDGTNDTDAGDAR